MTKYYFVCIDCGESFDDMPAAKKHEDRDPCSNEYAILSETEAM